MAKKSMQKIKYKSKKRERNKNKIEETPREEAKSILKTFLIVAVFLGVMYLMAFGLEKLGTFEKGYTPVTVSELIYTENYILDNNGIQHKN